MIPHAPILSWRDVGFEQNFLGKALDSDDVRRDISLDDPAGDDMLGASINLDKSADLSVLVLGYILRSFCCCRIHYLSRGQKCVYIHTRRKCVLYKRPW